MNSTPWLQHVSPKLAANGFQPLPPEVYQPLSYKYAVRRSRFEITKFGMAESFFMFAEIPDLRADVMQSFSATSFGLANQNKVTPLPNGLFACVFCYAVAMTERLDPAVAAHIKTTAPVKHWASNEIPVVFDLASGELCYFEGTPVWGAAYYAGFRREIESNLR